MNNDRMSQDISTERLDALIAHHQILFSIERLQTDELGKLNAEFQADQLSALLELKRRREQNIDTREAAMQDCWNAVDDLIREGTLPHQYQSDERNGLVMATNAITALIDTERKKNPGFWAAPKES